MDREQAVHVFLRVRPEPPGAACCGVEYGGDGRVAVFRRPAACRVSEHHKEDYGFTFDGLFDEGASQDQVFAGLAEPVVRAALDGVDGTIFAYGQTGSGKTYTLSGNPEAFEERGLLPRAIALIFQEIAARPRRSFSVHVSYMEVYNETGYDLLDTEREVAGLADLPQVAVLEDAGGAFLCRGLSRHWVASAEHAFNLLFLGATNRTISETPMNKASSRSHCIFTAHIESQEVGGDTVRTSRLSLVDLAGSERVHRTRVDGITLHEAKHINLSLHHLEQVIVALQEQADQDQPGHVPYRNSLLTMILRGCIGGQCKTCMVATVTRAVGQFEETLSTCRFAQRVACISYTATVNEAVSPELVIANLKQQVAELQAEVQALRGEEALISQAEQHAYGQQLLQFVTGAEEAAAAPVRLHSGLMAGALAYLRQQWHMLLGGPRRPGAAPGQGPSTQCAAGSLPGAGTPGLGPGGPQAPPGTPTAASPAAPPAAAGEGEQGAHQRADVLRGQAAERRAHACGLLQKVNAAQAELQGLRAALEKKRLQAFLAAGAVRPDPVGGEPASAVLELGRIEEVKAEYKALLQELDAAKAASSYLEQQAAALSS